MILVTGFEPFGPHSHNPSAELAEALGGLRGVCFEVLPVAWARAGARLRERIESERLDAVLALGLCAGARMLRFERVAHNRDDTASADNDGLVRRGEPIAADGPPRYPSTLPLSELARAVLARDQPVEWSDDAGGFLCNHVFYVARHVLECAGRAACPAGLVHVPAAEAVSVDAQLDALQACVERLR